MNNKLLLLSLLTTNSLGVFAEKEAPNIIFILADDLGYGDVSFLDANSKINTTNLDEMARDGVIFTDAHSSSSVSTPTRYGILTGRYNWRSKLKQGVLKGYSKALIPSDRQTMASMLKKQGYATAGIGKWHLGWDWNNIDAGQDNVDFSKPIENGPTTLGFDYFYGFCGSLDMPPYVYVENNMPTSVPNKESVNKGKYSHWRKGLTGDDFVHEEVLPNIVNRACKYITDKASSQTPYFLYLPFSAPHTPILPSKEFRGKSGLGEYGDFVLMLDAMVGRVLKAVKESGEENNTIIVFTSDNGCSPAAGIKELIKKGHHPNSVFRGNKADLFDGGHRIPCIIKWPARIKAHSVNQTICLTDFYATFAAINGYKLDDSEGEDSYNLLPAICSKSEVSPIREAIVSHSISGEFTIRQGNWKLLLSPSSGGWSAPRPNNKKALEGLPSMQLYNLSTDIGEKTNLVAKFPKKVNALKKLLLHYIDEGRSTPGLAQKNDSVGNWKQLTKLRSL